MPFTDEDLKQFKEWGESDTHLSTDIPDIRKMLPRLIARLEAAEQIIEAHSGHDADCHEIRDESLICNCGFSNDERLWHQTVGID